MHSIQSYIKSLQTIVKLFFKTPFAESFINFSIAMPDVDSVMGIM